MSSITVSLLLYCGVYVHGSHPLFPLLALIVDKCELATSTVPRDALSSSRSAQLHVCSSTSFDEDVRLFTRQVYIPLFWYVFSHFAYDHISPALKVKVRVGDKVKSCGLQR